MTYECGTRRLQYFFRMLFIIFIKQMRELLRNDFVNNFLIFRKKHIFLKH